MSLHLGVAGQSEGGTEHEQERQQVALKAAWRPVAAGWKAAWWDSIALPEGTQDEHAFRQGWLSSCSSCTYHSSGHMSNSRHALQR